MFELAFDAETVTMAYMRAGGKCECSRIGHGHIGRCGKSLAFKGRGKEFGLASWEVRHRTPPEYGGDNSLANCIVLCWSCHRKT